MRIARGATGEREFVKDNKSLGNFRLDGIPPAPRGVPQVGLPAFDSYLEFFDLFSVMSLYTRTSICMPSTKQAFVVHYLISMPARRMYKIDLYYAAILSSSDVEHLQAGVMHMVTRSIARRVYEILD